MKKILVVDDDAFVTSVYCNKFRSEGFEAETASTGTAALEKLKQETWDLVVLDLQLPDLSGVDILKFIRTESAAKKTPVVVFSNAFMGALVEAAWKAGANQLLTKAQCTPNQLVDAVRRALGVAAPSPLKAKYVSITTLKSAPSEKRASDTASRARKDAQAGAKEEDPQAELRRRFRAGTPETVSSLREHVKAFLCGRGEQAKQDALLSLRRTTHALIGSAGVAGYDAVARMASALEALFQELSDKPRTLNTSTLRTIVHGVDLLVSLCESSDDTPRSSLPPLALVVDDDPVAGLSVRAALEKVHVRSVVVSDPMAALDLCKYNQYELALLDVDMPGTDGVTLCAKIRALPDHEATRVIFVTALTNFKAVARGLEHEEDEVIAKPFAPIELAVKALTCLLKPSG